MIKKEGYIIIDIGTGNVRVAVTTTDGEILSLKRDNVHYQKDEKYPEALFFDPDLLWNQVIQLAGEALDTLSDIKISAITASSQREGIVLVDQNGDSLIGMPNHDHRGREYEQEVKDKDNIYKLTGRYPSSLFSALKIIGLKNKYPEVYNRIGTVMSISDWAQYKLCGIPGYEHAQASETLLYDIRQKEWSSDLCDNLGIDQKILPPLRSSGTVLGKISSQHAGILKISQEAVIVVGGADTQLAIMSTQPEEGDVIIVSGTTTPVVKIEKEYKIDDRQRTWTNRHVEADNFIIEANAGVTGLNYQRLKEIFYPNETYQTIENELSQVRPGSCVASLGSLIADESTPLTKGGFIFETPVTADLSRASFVWATLWDMACCIKENYEVLHQVATHKKDYIWACGGGFQSKTLRQFIANLVGKQIYVRRGFEQASVIGGAYMCRKALGKETSVNPEYEVTTPMRLQEETPLTGWKKVRTSFKITL